MNTINKDNAGSTILLAGMFLAIAAALFSSVDVNAKQTEAVAPHNTNASVETIVVTATRLK
jgi:hypothetical protein